MIATPVFDSALLSSILEAVERRGKAIRYHSSLECSREVDRDIERLNIDIKGDSGVRLSVWADGVLWLGITKPHAGRSGGWDINEQFDGRLGEIHPAELVAQL